MPSGFITALLQSNAAWAANVTSANATFFSSTATSQHPEILWIGCSDSRVPETTILGLEPGDVFTTRTVANIIQQDDLSTQAVLDVGVTKLKTKHLILCGHTNCGGVNLALGNEPLPPALAAWLAPLRVLRMRYSAELNGLTSAQASLRLTQLNVLQGVQLLRQNATVAAAMAKNGLVVHGMIYDVGTGILTELDTSTPT